MNYYTLVNTILDTAGKHKLIRETYYGDIYEFENSGSRQYNNFVLTILGTTESNDITTYQFTAFVTDRLTDDKSNLIEVQSLSKTILSQILKKCFDNISDITYTFWTEKFNDLCAGCYVNFSVSLPNEAICVDENSFEKDPEPEPEPQTPYAILVVQKSSVASENTAILLALCELFKKEDGTLFYRPQMLKFMNQTELYSDEWITNYNNTAGETFPTTFSEEAFAIFWQAVEQANYTKNIKIKYV